MTGYIGFAFLKVADLGEEKKSSREWEKELCRKEMEDGERMKAEDAMGLSLSLPGFLLCASLLFAGGALLTYLIWL